MRVTPGTSLSSRPQPPTQPRTAAKWETDKNGFPAGAYDVLMIGDSVSLRTIPNFEQTFPHGHIDAAKNRQFTTGVDLASQYIAGNQAGKS